MFLELLTIILGLFGIAGFYSLRQGNGKPKNGIYAQESFFYPLKYFAFIILLILRKVSGKTFLTLPIFGENVDLLIAISPNVILPTTVCLIVDSPSAILPNVSLSLTLWVRGENTPCRVKKRETCMFGGFVGSG